MEQKLEVHTLVVALGSNIGDKYENIADAISLIDSNIGKVVKKSSIFKNPAQGFDSENEFLNACLICKTSLNPFQILDKLQKIEMQLGRTKTKNSYEDRVIDLDIIFFDMEVIYTEKLQIPHAKYQNRDFVLIPLLELYDFQDPKTFLNISQLIR